MKIKSPTKSQIATNKSQANQKFQISEHAPLTSNKKFDLENRLLEFAKNTNLLCQSLYNYWFLRPNLNQLLRSSSSIGANYVEANQSFSKRDLIHKLKIARSEARETVYWLKLITETCNDLTTLSLLDEAEQISRILSSIINKLV